MSYPLRPAACSAVLVAACGNSEERPPLLEDARRDQREVVGPITFLPSGSAGAEGSEGAAGAASSSPPASLGQGGCGKGEILSGYVWDDAGVRELAGYTSIQNGLAIAPPGGESRTRVTDLSPLSCLQRVGGVITIHDNPDLTSLAGLGGLRSARTLDIFRNNRLTTLDALELLALEDQFLVQSNGSLRELGQGIVSAAQVEISLNAQLPQCQVDALLEALSLSSCLLCTNNDGTGSCD